MRIQFLWLLALALFSPNSFGQNKEGRKRLPPPPKERREIPRSKPGVKARTTPKVTMPPANREKPGSVGEKTSPASNPRPQDDFAATSRDIKSLLPAIDDQTLECDLMVIRMALPEIQRVYLDSELTKEAAQEAALTAWKEVRLGSPLQSNKCMDSPSYKAFTLSLGTLVFKTSPANAEIALNGNDLSVKTEYRRLFPAGKKYRIRFSKNGFEPVTIECTAVERTNTDCYAELKPIP